MLRVVVIAPGLDRQLRLGHRDKPVRVEALVAQATVEALDDGVLRGLPGPDEGQDDPTPVGPRVEHPPQTRARCRRRSSGLTGAGRSISRAFLPMRQFTTC